MVNVNVRPGRHGTDEVGPADVTDTGVAIEAPAQNPIIFLLGPPGAGKSSLGSRACKELGIRFLDLAAKPAANPSTGEIHSDLDRLSSLVADHTADVIELPWPLQHDRKALVLTRKSGIPLLLWAHPEDMQARSELRRHEGPSRPPRCRRPGTSGLASLRDGRGATRGPAPLSGPGQGLPTRGTAQRHQPR